MANNIIVFTDSGDTVVDEATQIYDKDGIVTNADFIPGAEHTLRVLQREGIRVTLVADGAVRSFQNVYRNHNMLDIFEAWVISEEVGVEKPAREMFDRAMREMSLSDSDKGRVVMIGNNLKKDIVGANLFGIRSVWLDWSPRYFHTIENELMRPTYTVKTHDELIKLLLSLEG